MTPRFLLPGLALLASFPLAAQTLDDAEVRLPYRELKELLANAGKSTERKPATPPPALLAIHLRLGMGNGQPFIEATCRATSFGGETTFIPLIGGDIALEKSEPEDAIIVAREDSLHLVADGIGSRTITLRLLPSAGGDGFTLALPPCPSLILETGELADGRSFQISHGNHLETLGGNQRHPLPASIRNLHVRLLDDQETRAALSPPEPSEWSWQHQALVMPEEDALFYQLVARSSAASGSGVSALLPLPRDAREITVNGADLVSHSIVRGENRSQSLALNWGTRGVLDRRVLLSYRMPLGPLDRIWQLQAPGGEDTRTRFMVATNPLLAYAAEQLSPPRQPLGLPADFIGPLHGNLCQFLEADTSAGLAVTPIPVADTAEGVITKADWSLKIEPDGAMLATGLLSIDHKGPFDLTIDTPEGMKLLSCEVSQKSVSPVDLGDGLLKLSLPAGGAPGVVRISFTGSVTGLDPVEGVLKLALPKTPVFIHALAWSLELPVGYQAETHGNLKRGTPTDKSSASRIHLTKNLCRDERPEVHVFYQRADIHR